MVESRRTPVHLRLAFGVVFWSATAVAFVIRELRLLSFIRRRLGWMPPSRRLAAFLSLSPREFFRAFAVAAAITVIADLLVRYVLAPRIARWLDPRPAELAFATPVEFHLGAREWVTARSPARRRAGRRWQPGELVLTNQRLLFLPAAWDEPTWSSRLGGLRSPRVEPAARLLLGLVRGLPDRVVLGDDEGETAFAVADPLRVLDWLRDHEPDRSRHLA